MPARRADLLFGSPTGVALLQASDLPDNAQICNCNGVSKRQIVDAIQTKGCESVSKVGATTKAGLGCGSCKGLVAQLLESCLGEVGYDPTEHYYVPGVALEKSQLVAEIKSRGLKSVSAVFEELAGGVEDPGSKVGLASLLKTLWPDEYDDERDARFINDRVHANIQKDGTFSVVPRIYGGVTTPDELMRIAQVAVKYNVPTVKITGGQRIDLLGIKKDDLPRCLEGPGHAERARLHEVLPHVQELRGDRFLPVRRRRFDCARAEDRAPFPGRRVSTQDETGYGGLSRATAQRRT